MFYKYVLPFNIISVKAEKKSVSLPSAGFLTGKYHGFSAYVPIRKIFFT